MIRYQIRPICYLEFRERGVNIFYSRRKCRLGSCRGSPSGHANALPPWSRHRCKRGPRAAEVGPREFYMGSPSRAWTCFATVEPAPSLTGPTHSRSGTHGGFFEQPKLDTPTRFRRKAHSVDKIGPSRAELLPTGVSHGHPRSGTPTLCRRGAHNIRNLAPHSQGGTHGCSTLAAQVGLDHTFPEWSIPRQLRAGVPELGCPSETPVGPTSVLRRPNLGR